MKCLELAFAVCDIRSRLDGQVARCSVGDDARSQGVTARGRNTVAQGGCLAVHLRGGPVNGLPRSQAG